jgi:hypothetical protein
MRRKKHHWIGAALAMLAILGVVPEAALAQSHRDSSGCAYAPGSKRLEIVFTRQAYTADGQFDGPVKVVRGDETLTADAAGYSFASNRPWYRQGARVEINEKAYVKAAPAKQLVSGASDMTFLGEYDRVPFFTMKPTAWGAENDAPGTIYVLYGNLVCEFEAYVPAH